MLMLAGFLTVVVLVAVALIFVMTRQVSAVEVAQANEFSCWDDDLNAVRNMRELAARCRAARGVRK